MNREGRIIELAEQSLNFRIGVPYSPLYLLRFFEWIAPHYSFLYLISKEFKPKSIVEIGMSWGIGAIHLALGNPNGVVCSIERDSECLNIYKGFDFGLFNIFPMITESSLAVDKFGINSIDLLYVDGDHQFECARKDYYDYFPKVKDGGIILIDDIELDEDMRQFWRGIKETKFDVNFIRPMDILRPERGVGFGVVLKGVQNET